MSDPKAPETQPGFAPSETPSEIRALALPDVIDGRYRVLGRLGAGAMGVVLRAEDLFLERPVAIKIVEPSLDPAVGQRFVKEAQALAQVRHENVVQVYAFGPFQQSSYLAMELVMGESLENVIEAYAQRGATMELSRAIPILRAIGHGLDAVHARRLVHRDVKPANVIIERGTDRPVLIDFGLARRRSKSSPKLSIVGGTPSYMAPEQARDPDGTRITSRADLYALGCTAFELLTGRPVFEGDDVYTVLLGHLNQEPRKVSTLRPDLAPVDDVIHRALAKNPDDRHGSASELVATLEVALSRAGAAPTTAPTVAVLAADGGLRRSLVRNTTTALRARGHEIRCDAAESAAEAAALVSGGRYDLVVIDEESAAGRLAELVLLVRGRHAEAEVVVVSRDFPATARALGDVRVRHLVPKPVNTHVLAAVIGRLNLVKPPAGRYSAP
ncbi:MAG: serine/threonine protein kinase [Labilithrix sp.]|nr:serine/threonine protein kinase [Labilithrix sp.]MCW5834993.1 serine/threonine protein kinase [Labilithrix sp.]